MGDDAKPDIVTLGKAISGGVTPVSGIVANDFIMNEIKPGDHGSTYGGNPLGMAIAKAAVECLVEEGMVENSLRLGKILHNRFQAFESPLIKDVRSRGLFCAIEFIQGEPVNGNDFARLLMENGLITKATHRDVVRFAPALIINEEELNSAADIIEKTLVDFQKLRDSRMV